MEAILEKIDTIENIVTKLGDNKDENSNTTVVLDNKESSLLTDIILNYVLSLKSSVKLLSDNNIS